MRNPLASPVWSAYARGRAPPGGFATEVKRFRLRAFFHLEGQRGHGEIAVRNRQPLASPARVNRRLGKIGVDITCEQTLNGYGLHLRIKARTILHASIMLRDEVRDEVRDKGGAHSSTTR